MRIVNIQLGTEFHNHNHLMADLVNDEDFNVLSGTLIFILKTVEARKLPVINLKEANQRLEDYLTLLHVLEEE